MDDQHQESGQEIHLPDPSPWPIIAGLAAMFLGVALVWWARDTGSDIASVALGAAGAVMLVTVAGWAYEDGRMRAKAASHQEHGDTGVRFTQVITFAIPEGQLDAARAGLLSELNARESSLRDLAGFQDFRIVVSPAATGTSQVLAETTWSSREGLATYDESRETLLDLINSHPDQVAAGTVQVFDMEVVRDSKDVAVRFGKGTAAAIIGALAVGGFFVGAGLTLFEGESTVVEGDGGGVVPPPSGFAQTGLLGAVDFAFSETDIALPPDTEITMTVVNAGAAPHNWHLFQSSTAGDGPLVSGCTAGCDGGGSDVATPILNGGESAEFTFTTPGPGEYAFWCSIHPTQMLGTLTVAEGVPVPGGGGGGEGDAGDTPSGTTSISAKDLLFSTEELQLPANQEVTVSFDNEDASIPHNIEFFEGPVAGQGALIETCSEGCADGGAAVKTALEAGPVTQTFTFTTPGPGTYSYWCVVHPTQMVGTVTIK